MVLYICSGSLNNSTNRKFVTKHKFFEAFRDDERCRCVQYIGCPSRFSSLALTMHVFSCVDNLIIHDLTPVTVKKTTKRL